MFRKLQGFIGLFLLIFSILFLFNGDNLIQEEQYLVENLADKSVNIDIKKIEKKNDGKLIYASGTVWTKRPISDETFSIKFYDSLALKRVVKIYEWKEKVEKKGGKPFYKYEKVWSDILFDSDKFEFGNNYVNPKEIPFQNRLYTSESAYLGKFLIPSKVVNKIAAFKLIDVSEFMSGSNYPEIFKIVDGIFFAGEDMNNPEIGDISVEFYAVYPFEMSIIGKQKGNRIVPYNYSGKEVLIAKKDVVGIDAMLQVTQKEGLLKEILFGIVAFITMCVGFLLIRIPFHGVLIKIPYFWELIAYASKVQFLIISILLSIVAIGLDLLNYKPLVGLVMISVSLVILVILRERKRL
ncbi:TMEM43 family protein [Pseudomonadota bacterium]